MTKRTKIIYWIVTLWLALGMAVTGVGQIINMKDGAGGLNSLTHLGYPVYVLTAIGILKVLGVATVLIPKLPLAKEWAYAGFAYLMIGALYSHVASADSTKELFGPALLLILTLLSWYFRPADRKTAAAI